LEQTVWEIDWLQMKKGIDVIILDTPPVGFGKWGHYDLIPLVDFDIICFQTETIANEPFVEAL